MPAEAKIRELYMQLGQVYELAGQLEKTSAAAAENYSSGDVPERQNEEPTP